MIYEVVMENLLVNLFFPGNGALANPGGSEGGGTPAPSGGEGFFSLLVDRMADSGVCRGDLLIPLVAMEGLEEILPVAGNQPPDRTVAADDGQVFFSSADSQAWLETILRVLRDSWSRIPVPVNESGTGETVATAGLPGEATEEDDPEGLSPEPGKAMIQALPDFVPAGCGFVEGGEGAEGLEAQEPPPGPDPSEPARDHGTASAILPTPIAGHFLDHVPRLSEDRAERTVLFSATEGDAAQGRNTSFLIAPAPTPDEAPGPVPFEEKPGTGVNRFYESLMAFVAARGTDKGNVPPAGAGERQESQPTAHPVSTEGAGQMSGADGHAPDPYFRQRAGTDIPGASFFETVAKEAGVQGRPEPVQKRPEKVVWRGLDPVAPDDSAGKGESADTAEPFVRVISGPTATNRFQVLYEKDEETGASPWREKTAQPDVRSVEFETMARDQYARVSESGRAAAPGTTEKANVAAMVVEKVDKVVEQYNTRGISGDLVVRVKLDEHDTLLVGLKEQGKVVTVEIKAGNEGTYHLLQSSKETIERQLESKNIFATINVDPDGQWAFEKREKGQDREGQRGRRTQVNEEFGSILEALG